MTQTLNTPAADRIAIAHGHVLSAWKKLIGHRVPLSGREADPYGAIGELRLAIDVIDSAIRIIGADLDRSTIDGVAKSSEAA